MRVAAAGMLGALNMKYRPERLASRGPAAAKEARAEMEKEMKAVRTELENTKKALKLQMSRCRHLVAAFTKKLAERDEEIKSSRELRDKQLSSVLRALLMLEARLRKEQKNIRLQLVEKDNIINNQQIEIKQLKSMVAKMESVPKEEKVVEVETTVKPSDSELFITDRECYVKPDLISSLGIDGEKRLDEDSPTPSLRYEPPSDSLSSDSTSTRSCLGDTSDSDFPSGPQSKTLLEVHDRSAFSPINKRLPHNFVKHESDEDFYRSKRERSIDSNQDSTSRVKHLPSTLLQEVRIATRSGDQNEYQDNPVLQCVNQILLKDQEDFLEEQRSLRLLGLDSGRNEESGVWISSEYEDSEDKEIEETKQPSPSGKLAVVNNLEKACLPMSNRLSLARVPDLEQSELQQQSLGKHQLAKKSVSLIDLSKSKLVPRPNPPLPPKPNRLSCMKRVEFQDKRIIPTTVEFHNPSMVLPPPQSVVMDASEIDLINKPPTLPLSMLEPIDQAPDNELYVISNSALDDDIVRQLQRRSVNGSRLDITLSPQRLGGDAMLTRTQHSNVPNGLLHPNHKPKKDLSNNMNLFLASNSLFNSPKDFKDLHGVKNSRQREKNDFLFSSPPKPGLANAIKTASPVAVLLTSGKAQETPETVKNDVSPSVSQMVRRFEDLGSKTGSPSLDDTAAAEEQSVSEDKESVDSDTTSASYDNFLEATGLSQKSIMTPSRMLSNHKSVLKPKDVKHRSRIKAAAVVEKVMPAQVIGPTIKYWTEPYL